MRSEELKVGVFDSGLGGLTVVKSIQKLLRNTSLYYIADTAHAPYGEKTQAEILQYSIDITDYFIENHQIDALVIACNTATSAAVKTLRERYPELIIVGTEPAIKPAIEQTKTGKIGVLATPATLKGDKYQQLANGLASHRDVCLFEQACPGLVEQIEAGEIDHPKTCQMLEGWLQPMRENGVDTIVLGCTHYPLAADVIAKIMQQEVRLLHTGDAIAKRLLCLVEEKGHHNEGENRLCIMTTDEIEEQIVRKILPHYDCFKPKSVKIPNS